MYYHLLYLFLADLFQNSTYEIKKGGKYMEIFYSNLVALHLLQCCLYQVSMIHVVEVDETWMQRGQLLDIQNI